MNNLTKTQTVIVQLLSDGNSAGEVAEYRCRSLGTIRKHIDLAKERMGARSTGHLIKLAVQQGLINSIFISLILSQVLQASNGSIDKRRLRAPRSFSVQSGRVKTNEV